MSKDEPGKKRVVVDPDVMTGKPVICGTRVTVELLLRKRSEGATEEELFEAYSQLEKEDLRAALAYAAESVSLEETVSA